MLCAPRLECSCSFGVRHRHPKRRLADLPPNIFHDRQSVIAILLIHGRLKSSSDNDDVSCRMTAMAASSSASGGQPSKEPRGGVALPPSAGTAHPASAISAMLKRNRKDPKQIRPFNCPNSFYMASAHSCRSELMGWFRIFGKA